MAQIGSNIKAEEINVFYSRLNAVRKNHALSTLSRSVVPNAPTKSSTMKTLENDLTNTANSSKYIPSKTYDLKSINVGDPTKYEIFSTVNTSITEMENVCAHDSHCAHKSHDGDNYDEFGDNSAIADYSHK